MEHSGLENSLDLKVINRLRELQVIVLQEAWNQHPFYFPEYKTITCSATVGTKVGLPNSRLAYLVAIALDAKILEINCQSSLALSVLIMLRVCFCIYFYLYPTS